MSENLWDDVLARVEGKINRHSFATWFRPTSYLAQDGSTLRIGVPNAQFREWLSKNYRSILQEALAEVGHAQLQVIFEERDEDAAGVTLAPVERESSALNPSTRSTASWSARPTSSRTPRRARWRRSPPSPTTRSSSTAAWASARRT
jgi:chromosomal replication initiation ATPase DnaA